MLNPQKNQKGFAAFYITLLIMAVILGIAGSIFISTWGEQKISGNIVKSSQAYYIAEAGIEDALFRLSKNPEWVRNTGITYQLKVDEATTTVKVSGIIGGSRTITSEGNMKERFRKIEVAYEVSTEKVSFRYGAQVDEGGMIMHNKSEIQGNIFSNGGIILSGAAGDKGIVTGGVIVASTSTTYGNNLIKGLKIGEDSGADAFTYSCESCSVGGKLYLSGGTAVDCTAGGGITSSEPVSKKPLPITQEQINNWETEASSSEIWAGVEIGIGETQSFGPRKIEGSLRIRNKGTLIMKGTIWVTGTTTIENGATVKLDQNSYGSKSGVLIVDNGKIMVENGAVLEGSGKEGSYLMLLSTNTSQTEDDPAIYVKNNALVAIFYTTMGLITLDNNTEAREITGYKIIIKPNAVIKYKTGLIDTLFTSGPGGSWKVTSWKEIE